VAHVCIPFTQQIAYNEEDLMYSPKYAVITNDKLIDSVISENPFATIVYQEDGVLESFHLPLILSGDKLIGHMAKANGAWKILQRDPALFIFHGPHCYISPVWYGAGDDVPTWNYISIQVRGKVAIHHDEVFLRGALKLLSQKYDRQFGIEQNIDNHIELLDGIVGIEISIVEKFAKFKLGQRKSASERLNVIKHLEQSLEPNDQLRMAKAMLETLSE
jgi:transcriptional regulator